MKTQIEWGQNVVAEPSRKNVAGHNAQAVLLAATTVLVTAGLNGCAHIEVTREQAKELIEADNALTVIDVREVDEYCGLGGHVPGALNYPWNSGVLQAKYEELPADNRIVVICRSGRRSNRAAKFLKSKGFSQVHSVAGGMRRWRWRTVGCVDANQGGLNDDLGT